MLGYEDGKGKHAGAIGSLICRHAPPPRLVCAPRPARICRPRALAPPAPPRPVRISRDAQAAARHRARKTGSIAGSCAVPGHASRGPLAGQTDCAAAAGRRGVPGDGDGRARNKVEFRVGSGLKDSERVRGSCPAAIGSVITYKFFELTRDGVPRFPTYLRVRPDVHPDEFK